MAFDKILVFLKRFNAIIKDRLRNPAKKEIDPILLDKLKTSCQFDVSDDRMEESIATYSS
jgi:hypothetical protein